jgi:putative Holliday junction resolvase
VSTGPAREDPPPPAERVLALDRGEVRVGVAISDELGLLAHPRPALDGRRGRAMFAAVRDIARREGVTRILVGYPLDPKGDEGPAARRAARFAREVADATGLTVELVDERMTTRLAERSLSEAGVAPRDRRDKVDGAAAAWLLQGWLDARRA